RSATGLRKALDEIPAIREAFWREVSVPGSAEDFNMALEYAGRVADFMEFGEVMCRDALARNESCGGHFREEYQTPDGDTMRDDDHFQHVAVWEYRGPDQEPARHE